MKRIWKWVLPAALLLTLTGCRTRIIADARLADAVERVEVPAPEEPAVQEEQQTDPPSPEEEVPDPDGEEPLPGEAEVPDESGSGQLREETALGVELTYDSGGGEPETVRTLVRSGGTYGRQPEVTRRGFAFAGWYTAPEGGERVTPETPVTREEAHTLYAHWEGKDTCTVTFDGNGGRVQAGQARVELSAGETFGAMPTALREGYRQTGWFTAPEGGEQVGERDVFDGAGDVTLYAQWAYEPYGFWSVALQDRMEQIYQRRQAPVYLETQTVGKVQYAALLEANGSLNVVEMGESSGITDEWVKAKKPTAVVKLVDSMDFAPSVRQDMAARFPDQEIIVVDGRALWDRNLALYAELAVACHLYGDWFADVDLDQAARELGISEIPVDF